MFVFTHALPVRARQVQQLGRIVGRQFHPASHRTQGPCWSGSLQTQALFKADLWRPSPAPSHLPHARLANTAVMGIAARARTSQATHTTRAVAGQARLAAVGLAVRDTTKVAGLVTYLLPVVGRAGQESTVGLVRATHAQTNQAMLITPVMEDQARPGARGAVLMDITPMDTRAHIHIPHLAITTIMTSISAMLSLQYFEVSLAVWEEYVCS